MSKKLKNLLKAIDTALSDPVFIIDNQGNYIEVIGGEVRSLYSSSDFLIGKNIHDILPKKLSKKFIKIINDAINDNSFKTIEYKLDTEDIKGANIDGPSGEQWFEGRISPIDNEWFNTPAVAWTAVNITNRKQLEIALKELSESDPLTGAYNRRYFYDELTKYFNLFKRYPSELAILMIDIDHFKIINDTYGHNAGDKVLKNMVNLSHKIIRKTDIFARVGGEEFAILLPNTDIKSAIILAERLRLAATQIKTIDDSAIINFTISIGLSDIFPTDKKVEEVMNRADEALYDAKENGRNQLVTNTFSDIK